MSLKIYNNNDFEQQSEEWFKIRQLKLTASDAGAIIANGKGLDSVIARLISEKYSTTSIERFSSKDTERGNELESDARTIYEMERHVEVKTVAFIELDENVGCSPDGLVNDDGLVEIKSPDHLGFVKIALYGIQAVDKDYIAQCKWQLYVTGRKWNDLMIYNPNYNLKNLLVFRITLSEADKLEISNAIIFAKQKLLKAEEDFKKLI